MATSSKKTTATKKTASKPAAKKTTAKKVEKKPAAKKPAAKKPADKKPAEKKSSEKKSAKAAKIEGIKRLAASKNTQEHIQTRRKPTDPKPDKIPNKFIKLTDGQEKFVWEKAEPVSATNASIFRQDVAGAIMKINEYGQASEFGWVYSLIDPDGEKDDVNNVVALHWMNAKVKRKTDEPWIAVVCGGRDITGLFNQRKEVKIPWNQLRKTRKTVLFQPKTVEPRKINIEIRKAVKK